jgi:hypothetical protein
MKYYGQSRSCGGGVPIATNAGHDLPTGPAPAPGAVGSFLPSGIPWWVWVLVVILVVKWL